MLPPAARLVGAQLDYYISDDLYWVLHAPRQSGKTTFLQNWAMELNGRGDVVVCYISVEACQGILDIDSAMETIYAAICEYAKAADLPVPNLPINNAKLLLQKSLRKLAELTAPKPLVVLFDEVDVMENGVMISFLRQLRGGFAVRAPGVFPTSVALVGMRDLRDYITAAKDGFAPNPGSPFNIKTDSVFITNFSKNDVAELFSQRTEETGQRITPEALDYVYGQSWGQPWIVNYLFNRVTMRILGKDNFDTVTLQHVSEARERMIAARETHLDALAVRLLDPRVRRVIESILTGAFDPSIGRNNPDVELSIDLGLVKWESETGFSISNPIYEEIIVRFMNSGFHDILPPPSNWRWQTSCGRLDMDSLLREFQHFWRVYSERWEEKTGYTEAFPHLLLTAFLQRILNGGGRVDLEAAAGRGRMDILVEYKGERFIIEIKLIHSHDNPVTVKNEGLKQIAGYRDKAAPEAASYLVIFDRRASAKDKGWDARATWAAENGITIIGC